MERNRLSAVLLKILDAYPFNNLAIIKKIAVTHLYSAAEFHRTYNHVSKEKEAEQHILTKYCKCNSFRVGSHLLKLCKNAITRLALGQSRKHITNFEGH